MAQCIAKTSEGRPCQIPAPEGKKYCHIHRRQRIWRLVTISSLFSVGLVILGTVSDVLGIVDFFGKHNNNTNIISVSSATSTNDFSPNTLSSPNAAPQNTPDAQQISIYNLVGSIMVNDIGYANLDGAGAEEVIITSTQTTSPFLPYISVFSYFDDVKKWLQVLHLEDDMHCGFHFDFLNLKSDNSRQLLVYRECGSGSFVYLEIFEYQGFKFMSSLYKPPDAIGHSTVHVVNQQLFVISNLYNKFYLFKWDGARVNLAETEMELPPNTKEVHYWRNGDDVVFSEDYVDVVIGQLILFIHDKEKDTDFCAGAISTNTAFLEFTEYPNALIPRNSGYTSVTVACKFQPAVANIDIVINK